MERLAQERFDRAEILIGPDESHVRDALIALATLLKDRPPELAGLYRKLEATINGFGAVEVVTRNRYALFRTTRIFTDLTVMRDALRVVIHLGRKVSAPCFVKIGDGLPTPHAWR